MRLSERWLRAWVDPALDRDGLVHQLTMAGLEVDAVEAVAPDFQDVVVGLIQEVSPHPDADRLTLCRVDDGSGDHHQVVCGADNVRAGMKAPFARVDARLPDGTVIRRARVRGQESAGMLCSAAELGLADSVDGLLELPEALAPGTDLREALHLDDAAIEIDLTPNRGDCLSVLGIAREVAALNACPIASPAVAEQAVATEESRAVRLMWGEAAPRYVGRIMRDVDVTAPSPLWLTERLRRSGIRSLGAVVDVTNYVLLELGQPMHAFDLEKLEGDLQVRAAGAGETLALLDGRTVTLDAESLVIADEARPVALAGVMGGEETAVGPQTRDIWLESAFFAPRHMAGRARRYGLHTDSSHRFERGVDPTLQERAMERATALLLEITGGRPGPVTVAEAAERIPGAERIRLRPERLARLLGIELPPEEIADYLQRLGATVESDATAWVVTPPPWRFDLEREVDLVEEVARLHGYDNLPETRITGTFQLPRQAEPGANPDRLRDRLVARGYTEAMTYSFVPEHWNRAAAPDTEPLRLANPLSEELAVMRTSLWPGLLRAMAHNRNRQEERIRLFELAKIFRPGDDGLQQPVYLGGVSWGPAYPRHWDQPERPADFYDVKGDVEALLALTGRGGDYRFRKAEHPMLHPGQSARIVDASDQPCGWLGALHPETAADLDVPRDVLLFELDTERLQPPVTPVFQAISRFPAIRRDLALIVDESVPAEAVEDVARRAGGKWLDKLIIFDVYRGKNIDSGKKSLAIGLSLRDAERTLNDEEVDECVQEILQQLKKALGAELRG